MKDKPHYFNGYLKRISHLLIFFWFILISPIISFGQSPSVNHWFFGNHVHFDFNGGNLIVDTLSPFLSYEGTCTISDDSGEILFISMGVTYPPSAIYSKVYDANFNVMPNGDSLLASISAIQASIAIKIPGSTSKYYLFNNSAQETEYWDGITYSVIDMSLNNGLGDVDVSNKNIQIPHEDETSNSEAMTIVRHCNGNDFWLITEQVVCVDFPFGCYPNNNLLIYSISETGVSYEGAYQGLGYCCGAMKFNPQGNKFYYGNILYDFDNETGTFSNPIDLSDAINTQSLGMCSFSQSGSKLYLKDLWGELYQFDLTLPNFQNLPIIIPIDWPASWNKPGGPMQLAPNGKIYLAWSDFQIATPWNYLGVINQPENSGVSCELEMDAILVSGYNNQVPPSMPSFVESDFSISGEVLGCITSNLDIDEELLQVYPNPTMDYIRINGIDMTSIQRLTIVDGIGKIHIDQSGRVQGEVNVSNLSTGSYVLRMELTNGQTIFRNIVKL